MDISQIITASVAILALASAGGFGLLRGRVATLRAELKDEREGRASDRLVISDLKIRAAEAEHQVKSLRVEVDALGRQVRLEGTWQDVGALLQEHNDLAVAYFGRADKRNELILKALREIGPHE